MSVASTDFGARFRLSDPPFAGRSGRGVRVAVIDSGIRAPHPHVPRVAGGGRIVLDESQGEVRAVDGGYGDGIGHGTAVAAAIHEKAPDASLWAVKVFERKLSTSTPVLAAGIELAASYGARIINLSLGTANDAHAALLEESVRSAAARGSLVVSALEWKGIRCFPGSLAGVVGVRLDAGCARDEIHVAADRAGVLLTASPFPRPIPGVPQERNLSGISFAVANATGFLARLLEGTDAASLDELRHRFRSSAE